jgi:hypothetical protein
MVFADAWQWILGFLAANCNRAANEHQRHLLLVRVLERRLEPSLSRPYTYN